MKILFLFLIMNTVTALDPMAALEGICAEDMVKGNCEKGKGILTLQCLSVQQGLQSKCHEAIGYVNTYGELPKDQAAVENGTPPRAEDKIKPVVTTPLGKTNLLTTPMGAYEPASTPLSKTELAETRLENTPLASTPMATTPVAVTPLAKTPFPPGPPAQEMGKVSVVPERQDPGHVPSSRAPAGSAPGGGKIAEGGVAKPTVEMGKVNMGEVKNGNAVSGERGGN